MSPMSEPPLSQISLRDRSSRVSVEFFFSALETSAAWHTNGTFQINGARISRCF